MAPGPLLAMVLGAVAGEDGEGLAGLSGEQLIGFLSGTRRMESRMAWAKMAALAEFASRPRRQDFAADEIASAFGMTWLSAAGEIDYARTVARRLPVTFAALAAGRLHPVHVKIIEEVTSILSDQDAAAARNPATRWCVTVLRPDGTAAAHGCAAGSRRWPPGPGPPGPATLRGLLEFLNITTLTPVYSGRPSAIAVAAVIRSAARPRGLRPAAMTSAVTRP